MMERPLFTNLLRPLLDILVRFSVNITPEGKSALLSLSKGDMRRALNILQVNKRPTWISEVITQDFL
jgi:DNA polymerase III delta prime subunit